MTFSSLEARASTAQVISLKLQQCEPITHMDHHHHIASRIRQAIHVRPGFYSIKSSHLVPNSHLKLGAKISSSEGGFEFFSLMILFWASSLLRPFLAAQCTMHNQDLVSTFRIRGLAASWPFFWAAQCTMHNQDLVKEFRIWGLAASWPFSGLHNAQCTIRTWSANSEFGD